MLLRDPQVGRGRELQPAAERRPVQHRDQRLAQAGEAVEDAVAVPDPAPPHVERLEPAPGDDVRTAAEGLRPRPGQDGDADLAVAVDPVGRRLERLQHRHGERVQLLRPLERQDGDAVLDLDAQVLLHRQPSGSVEAEGLGREQARVHRLQVGGDAQRDVGLRRARRAGGRCPAPPR